MIELVLMYLGLGVIWTIFAVATDKVEPKNWTKEKYLKHLLIWPKGVYDVIWDYWNNN